MSEPTAKPFDPAATEKTSETPRYDAQKRLAPDEPAGLVQSGASTSRFAPLQRSFGDDFRRVFEVETVGVLFFTVDGLITDANEAFLKMSGFTREDVEKGRVRWNGFTPVELRPLLVDSVEQLKREGKTGASEREYIRPDGTRWWGLVSATRLTEDLAVEYIVNISEQKRSEEALRAGEERFRQFAENSADVFWIIDGASRQLDYINPAYEKMWGAPRDEIMRDANQWRELVHPRDRERVQRMINEVFAGKPAVVEYRIIRRSDRAVRSLRTNAFPIFDNQHRVIRAAGVTHDVTEEKARTEALAESEERFRLLVEGAPDHAMFLLDPGNRIIYWSTGAEKVFGWSADEALGRSGEIVFTPEDRARKQEEKEMQIALRKGVASDRRWHLRKDGSRVWIDGVMRRLDDENGNLRAFAKIARDATEIHQAEEELQISHRELENRVRERTAQLTALNKKLQAEMKGRAQVEQELLLISEREKRRMGQDLHDSLCQELAAAALFLRTASHKMEKKSPSGAKVLEDAARIVNDNVGLARDLARGLHPVELSSQGLANALRELAFRTSQIRSVTCHFECPRQVRIRDEAVALNLYRIAQEAVANAVKHGKATTIAIKLVREGKELALGVKDDGKGFSPAKPRHGMGLHIMKYRAGVIGARLTIESAEGHGALVKCVLPGE
jgi:PAS domain S-box-containing protein